jgi:uncharacterized membrane protein (UPF0127 family)
MTHHTLYVEKKFVTPEERAKGLMFDYDPLRPFSCALFVFPTTQILNVWMKNTPCALDVIFIDDNMRVVDMYIGMKPYDETSIRSREPARYFVEVLTGYCNTYKIKINDTVTFQHVDPEESF